MGNCRFGVRLATQCFLLVHTLIDLYGKKSTGCSPDGVAHQANDEKRTQLIESVKCSSRFNRCSVQRDRSSNTNGTIPERVSKAAENDRISSRDCCSSKFIEPDRLSQADRSDMHVASLIYLHSSLSPFISSICWRRLTRHLDSGRDSKFVLS